ncbi:hypothetical protein LR48_Vigan09g062700 [Vigna angularis]|uniref:Uncharacterized protein n=1 Tax=Phaseolus angularis TaxID=3914 RepID=A0A0L9VAF4_PHAAN|nr:hypothetical protein LR48_Vigan09g062700 [Vigna angularis]
MNLVAGSYEKFIWASSLLPAATTTPSTSTISPLHPPLIPSTKTLPLSPPSPSTPLPISPSPQPHLRRRLSLTIFDVDGFVHLTTLSVHCNADINDLALHPSDERALNVALTTASPSSTLSAAVVNLDKEATLVKFNVTGDHFFVAAKEKGFVQQTEDARIFFELECSKPVLYAAPARVVSGYLVTDVTAMLCSAPVSGLLESVASSGKDKTKKPGRYG